MEIYIIDSYKSMFSIRLIQIFIYLQDPKMTKEPVVCKVCSDFLEKASHFMINSLNVEQKIKNYYDESKTEEAIDLFNVLEFSFPKIEMEDLNGCYQERETRSSTKTEPEEQKYSEEKGKKEVMKQRPLV